MATENDTATNVIAFPEAAIFRRPPSLETVRTVAERRALIDALEPAEHMSLEASLADDLFSAIMGRNARSLRPEMHPKALCPAFGQNADLKDERHLGSIEEQHLFSLRRARERLNWLVGRLERKQARKA